MRDRDDRDARLAALGAQQLPNVERHALEPRVESRRREKVVHPHRELGAILRRIKGLEVERADARHRRPLDLRDESREIEVLARAPGPGEEIREEDVFATLD